MAVEPFRNDLTFEPLAVEHLPALAAAIRKEEVYRHIGGALPSLERFHLGLERAIQGPPRGREHELWINYLVRLRTTREVIGRVEATVIRGTAEVAFLFNPAHWGRGYATQRLHWLHCQVRHTVGEVQFWATTVPDNTRCRALLQRCGYVEVDVAEAPALVSYADGDLVYRHEVVL
jgi:RimJ/RimL family protein N-acetyltransferase